MPDNIQFTVIGEEKLHCEGCERRVARALKRLDGVREVEADRGSQEIAVEYEPAALGEEEIRERLDLLGYEVERI